MRFYPQIALFLTHSRWNQVRPVLTNDWSRSNLSACPIGSWGRGKGFFRTATSTWPILSFLQFDLPVASATSHGHKFCPNCHPLGVLESLELADSRTGRIFPVVQGKQGENVAYTSRRCRNGSARTPSRHKQLQSDPNSSAILRFRESFIREGKLLLTRAYTWKKTKWS